MKGFARASLSTLHARAMKSQAKGSAKGASPPLKGVPAYRTMVVGAGKGPKAIAKSSAKGFGKGVSQGAGFKPFKPMVVGAGKVPKAEAKSSHPLGASGTKGAGKNKSVIKPTLKPLSSVVGSRFFPSSRVTAARVPQKNRISVPVGVPRHRVAVPVGVPRHRVTVPIGLRSRAAVSGVRKFISKPVVHPRLLKPMKVAPQLFTRAAKTSIIGRGVMLRAASRLRQPGIRQVLQKRPLQTVASQPSRASHPIKTAFMMRGPTAGKKFFMQPQSKGGKVAFGNQKGKGRAAL